MLHNAPGVLETIADSALSADLRDLLTAHMTSLGVPGAQVSVLRLDTSDCAVVGSASAGVVNLRTGYEVRDSTLFQIGSISKVWTAVLILQLVSEHRVGLDQAVAELLPEFREVPGASVYETVTVRDLLCHTSGLQGDWFGDTGDGTDGVERYVRQLVSMQPSAPVTGEMSYCNGGYVVLGRLIEVLRGMSWDAAVQRFVADRGGLLPVVTRADQAILFSVAVGHQRTAFASADGSPIPVEPVSEWGLPRSSASAGAICATSRTLVLFDSIFLRGGVAPSGERLLPDELVAAMTTPCVDMSMHGALFRGWSLGWSMPAWQGERAWGHSGATNGQRAYTVGLPDLGVAIGVVTNADCGSDLASALVNDVAELLGIAAKPVSIPPAVAEVVDPTEAHARAGHYRRPGAEFWIVPGGPTGMVLVREPDDDDGPWAERLELAATSTQSGTFRVNRPGHLNAEEFGFVDRDGHSWLAMDHRLTPLVGRDLPQVSFPSV